jgi:CheY-like chemotaxis protein
MKRKVLIVENDVNDAFLIDRALRSFEHCDRTFVCRNETEAKAYLSGAGMFADRSRFPLPDLIITDLRLLAESGAELISWIQDQAAEIKRIAVVILTGSSSPSDWEAAENSGAHAVFQKPVKFDGLQSLLASIVRFPELAHSV